MKKSTINLLVLTASLLFVSTASAEGKDLLISIMPDIKSTISGTGKSLIYVGEGIVAIVAYIRKRNVTEFLGILAVMIFVGFVIAKV